MKVQHWQSAPYKAVTHGATGKQLRKYGNDLSHDS